VGVENNRHELAVSNRDTFPHAITQFHKDVWSGHAPNVLLLVVPHKFHQTYTTTTVDRTVTKKYIVSGKPIWARARTAELALRGSHVQ